MESAAIATTEGTLEPSSAPAEHDPTFYPVEVKVGQDSLQTVILELLRPLVERWLRLLGKPSFVGTDQFIYYKQFHPECVVAPDLYVLPGVRPGRRIKSWKVWETGIVPSFAFEVVASKDFEKDYREAVQRYAELGVSELVIFDPDYELDVNRVQWQRYRKVRGRGFVQVESVNGPRVRSQVLGCFLTVTGEGEGARVRLATGKSGTELLPTQTEEERSAKEAALAEKEQERAKKEAALARIRELEAMLLTKGHKPKP